MFENLQQLSNEYHAFYEVLPYHVVVEERHGSPAATKRIIQAGFDVDVHGFAKKGAPELPLPADYSIAHAELKQIAETISHASECCIEVIPFPATVFFEAREQLRSEAVLRIRISHQRGGVDRLGGPPEQHALEEVERQLHALGIRRR